MSRSPSSRSAILVRTSGAQVPAVRCVCRLPSRQVQVQDLANHRPLQGHLCRASLVAPDFAGLAGSAIQQLGVHAGAQWAPLEDGDDIAFLHVQTVDLGLEPFAVDDKPVVIFARLDHVTPRVALGPSALVCPGADGGTQGPDEPLTGRGALGSVTNVFGVSARAMRKALIAGAGAPEALAELAKRRLRRKRPVLAEALTGRVTAHHRFMLEARGRYLVFRMAEVAVPRPLSSDSALRA